MTCPYEEVWLGITQPQGFGLNVFSSKGGGGGLEEGFFLCHTYRKRCGQMSKVLGPKTILRLGCAYPEEREPVGMVL